MRLASLALCCLATCTPAAAAQDYWIWDQRVEPARILADAGTLYLLVGELLSRPAGISFQRRGLPPPANSRHPLMLVYRLEAMAWQPLQSQVRHDLAAFEARGNRVLGIQLDFDAATRHLDRYGELLGEVRADLPPHYRLSATGLMDWASQGRPEDLDGLIGVVDELVFQTYQGERPVPQIDRYLERLAARPLRLPFRIGLVEGGEYPPELLAAVAGHPAYRGTVLFLLPP